MSSGGVQGATKDAGAGGKAFKASDGDWICSDPQCGNMNFARRTSCNRCGKDKDSKAKVIRTGGVEIGKAAAEKSKGLFSADDWQCKTCGNVNWARRNECNMCKAPKYGKMEERTGYGGGYNEREDVEYVEREESDGEYDEFGRKKKKFRGATSKASTPPRQEAGGKDDDDDDDDDDDKDDEEEEEEGDVSKYDLDSDEEEDDADLSKYQLSSDEENSHQGSHHSSSGSSSRSSRSRSSSSGSRSGSSASARSRSRSRSKHGEKRRHSQSRSRSGSRKRNRRRSGSGSRSSSGERFGSKC